LLSPGARRFHGSKGIPGRKLNPQISTIRGEASGRHDRVDVKMLLEVAGAAVPPDRLPATFGGGLIPEAFDLFGKTRITQPAAPKAAGTPVVALPSL